MNKLSPKIDIQRRKKIDNEMDKKILQIDKSNIGAKKENYMCYMLCNKPTHTIQNIKKNPNSKTQYTYKVQRVGGGYYTKNKDF